MRFHQMQSLTASFPNIELRSGEAVFDIHNAGVLERMNLDFEAKSFEVSWRVENLLGDARIGRYRSARIVLSVKGVTACSGLGEIFADSGEEVGIDFIDYSPDQERTGMVRFVFTSSGEVSVWATDCVLYYTVLEAL